MNLSRFLGVAVACGALLGGDALQAQMPTFPMANMPSPNGPQSYGQQPMSAAANYYPTQYYGDAPNGFSATSMPMQRQMVNSFPTRLPMPGGMTSLVGDPVESPHSPNSVVATPSPSDALGYGQVMHQPGMNYGAQQGYGYGAQPAYGVQPGYGALPGYGYGAGGYAMQPFADGCHAGYGIGGSYVGPNRWYGGVYGLIMDRDRQDNLFYSFDTGAYANQYVNVRDTNVGYSGGFAVVAGKYFNCGQNAIEAIYWGWFPNSATTSAYGSSMVGNLNGNFGWDYITYGAQLGGYYVNDATIHVLTRNSEIQNIELNVLKFCGTCGGGGGCAVGGCGSGGCDSGGYGYGMSGGCGMPSGCGFTRGLQYSLVAGVRYFRFRDELIFDSDRDDIYITRDATEIQYQINCVNNLIGFQLGGVGTYCVSPRLSLNAGTKFGLFGNHISHLSQITGSGGYATINTGPYSGQSFYSNGSKNDVGFLGEVFLGANYMFGCRWSASAGYRALAVTGLALPDAQVVSDLRLINHVNTIESNGCAILHGAFAGAQFCF